MDREKIRKEPLVFSNCHHFRVRLKAHLSAAVQKDQVASSRAFRCVQAWLQEKSAAWVGEDAPDLVAALTVQRAPCKHPREDALHKAERSHQRRRIERLEKQLDESKEREKEPLRIVKEMRRVSSALLSRSSRRDLRTELALRCFEADAEWCGRGTIGGGFPF